MLATGGADDVLTGLISALIAQGIALIQAIITGTKIHVQVAEELTELGGMLGVIASGLIPKKYVSWSTVRSHLPVDRLQTVLESVRDGQ